MNRRERELLDRQMRAITPPRTNGLLVLTALALFAAGIIVGGFLAEYRAGPTRMAWYTPAADTGSPVIMQP
jgi:hypothetical protein